MLLELVASGVDPALQAVSPMAAVPMRPKTRTAFEWRDVMSVLPVRVVCVCGGIRIGLTI